MKTLLSVIEAGSIAKAAQLENLSAPALGQRITALEDQLKVQLLVRAKHRSQPTRACQRLMPLFLALAQTANDIRHLADPDGLSGPYRLGMVGTALADHSKAIVSSFQHEAPSANLSIIPGSSIDLYEKLARGCLDAILAVRPPFSVSRGLTFKTVDRSQTVFISPKGHDDPASLPILLYDKQAWGGALIWNWLVTSGGATEVLCEMDEPLVIANLVATGLGAAYLPHWKALDSVGGLEMSVVNMAPVRELAFIYHESGNALDDVVLRAVTAAGARGPKAMR
ncbi:LysR family transcriptional regulator [Oceanicaulis sp.]|uniref:LysR family transcriptional regulator n=1 Tax=Oceanicaulis sp. TaxID=1924941 RepID=UPI003D285E25